jgi:hypothetical protein
MRCELCANEATIHLTDLASGEPQDRYFCETHGQPHLPHAVPRPESRFRDSWPDADTSVTLTVTQSDIDQRKFVSLRLPTGLELPLRLGPGVRDGSCGPIGPPKGIDKKGNITVTIRVVPDGESDEA